MSKKIHSKSILKNHRRELRKNATPAERYLWTHLKNKQAFGLRFQRQHSIDNYIVDFYCASIKLIIELDGDYHHHPEQIDKDAKRDEKLEKLGFKVLRFENKMAFENLDSIIGWIKEVKDELLE
ncbi:cytosine methyltransferase [Nonlabens spongiae]|uniref:Cytosine methyltransferase n=1 Tax=Nonlabens spongiae TaxID=331648 RepID=A0A1W6MH39_9FLAO|nr:endonuclease domain-containing protein [Nonlabens spongiae]ARN76905.1 cytosine methyltransferase [Nonlabens spongiae]